MKALFRIAMFSLCLASPALSQPAVNTLNLMVTMVDWGGGLEDPQPYWERAVPAAAHGPANKVLRVAYFPQQERLVLYEFPAGFPSSAIQSPDYPSARDAHAKLLLPIAAASQVQRSAALVDGFVAIFAYLAEHFPHERLVLTYSGHGTGTGSLFAGYIGIADVPRLLQSYLDTHGGRRLAVLDLSTNCIEGSMRLLANVYRYTDFVYASALERGGYQLDAWNDADYERQQISSKFGELYTPAHSTLEALQSLQAHTFRYDWLLSRASMVREQRRQSLSIFASAAFATFADDYRRIFPVHCQSSTDREGAITVHGEPRDVYERIMQEVEDGDRARLLAEFYALRVGYTSNNNDDISSEADRVFFSWATPSHGLNE